jgi:hypothetical protein
MASLQAAHKDKARLMGLAHEKVIERASAVHAKDNEMAKRHAKHVTKLSLSCASEKGKCQRAKEAARESPSEEETNGQQGAASAAGESTSPKAEAQDRARSGGGRLEERGS